MLEIGEETMASLLRVKTGYPDVAKVPSYVVLPPQTKAVVMRMSMIASLLRRAKAVELDAGEIPSSVILLSQTKAAAERLLAIVSLLRAKAG